MQIIKPKKLGLIHKPFYLKKHQFAIGALAFFPLGGKGVLLEEFEQWQKCLSQLPPIQPLDMGFPKPRSEVLLSANGYYHQHGLLFTSKSAVEIAKIKKKVSISRKNNGQRIKDFMPLDVNHKKRKKYNGKYNRYWLENIHPGFPDDTNPLLFNSAPEDQQLKTLLGKSPWFKPGEEYKLSDLHPSKKIIEGTLPDIRVRTFISKAKELTIVNPEDFQELKTVLETVWFFPEVELGVCLYRSVVDISDSDALDVRHIMLAYENSNDEARTEDDYYEVMKLRANPETALAHVFNESQLSPKKTAEEIENLNKLIQQEENEKQKKIEGLSEQYRKQAKEHIDKAVLKGTPGYEEIQNQLLQSSTEEDDEWEMPTIPKAVAETGDFDLTEVIEGGKKLQDKLQEKMEEQQKAMDATVKEYQEKYKKDIKPESESADDIKARLLQAPVLVGAADLKEKEQSANSDDLLSQLHPAVKQQLVDQNVDIDSLLMAHDHLKTSQRQARQSSPSLMTAKEISKETQEKARFWVKALINSDEILAGRDYSNLDLSDMDFSGLDLRDAMFDGCNLNNSVFKGCQLDGAVFTESQLDKTCFDDSSLKKTNFCQSKGMGASFKGTDISFALFTSASLINSSFQGAFGEQFLATSAFFSETDFSHVDFNHTDFTMTKIGGSKWLQAKVSASIFLESSMPKSVWIGAKLERCLFIDIEANHINLKGAELEKVQFSNKGNLQYANMEKAKFLTCGFRGVDLTKLSASYALFKECDFGETVLHKADLNRAVFIKTMMSLADFQESECFNTFFNESIIRKVNFEKTTLTKAEFYNCTLEKNNLKDCYKQGVKVMPQKGLL